MCSSKSIVSFYYALKSVMILGSHSASELKKIFQCNYACPNEVNIARMGESYSEKYEDGVPPSEDA